jgi:Tfp pilus assembly protein PilF
LAQVYLAQSKFVEAAGELEHALGNDPRNGEFHSDYGCALERLGRLEEAAIEHQKAIQLSPKSGRVHYNYAVFLLASKKLDQALRNSRPHCNTSLSIRKRIIIWGALSI